MEQIAYLKFRETTYWSAYSPAPHEPFSAVLRLVQGIYEEFPAMARAMVRARIYTNYAISELDRAVVKVAAKRVTESTEFAHPQAMPGAHEVQFLPAPAPAARRFESGPVTERVHVEEILKNLEANCRREAEKFRSDRPVAAVLLSSAREVLASSWNANRENRTQHAEVRALQQYWLANRRPLPRDTVFVCSLKPCRMCAAMLWQIAEDPFSLRVLYVEDDPGTAARHTLLGEHSLQSALDRTQTRF